MATVSFNIKDLGITNLTANTIVTFELKNTGKLGIPRVVGTNVIATPTFSFTPNGSGNVTGSIQGNDTITVGTNAGGTYYRISVYFDGALFRADDYFVLDAQTFDLSLATPIFSPPVVTPPAGDTTYLRLDASNTSLTATTPFKLNATFKGLPWFDVRAFGATGNGITNDWASIQAAINAAQAVSGIVFFPYGAYIVNQPLQISNRVVLIGVATDLAHGSLIASNSLSADIIQLNQGAQGSRIRDLAFTVTGGTPVNGAAIDVNLSTPLDGVGASPFEISNCVMSNVYNGVLVQNCNIGTIRGLFTGGVINDAIKVTGGLSIFIDQCNFIGQTIGIELVGGAAFFITDTQTFGGTHGLVVSGGAQILAENCVFDVPTGDAVVISTAGGQMEFKGCWAAGSSTGYGINISNTNGFNWVGGWIRNNFLSGVRIQSSAVKVSIANARISGNGINNGTPQNGVLVDADTLYFQVLNNQLGFDNGDPPAVQGTGVKVSTGASDHYIIMGNLNTDPSHQTLVTDGGTGSNKVVTGNV